MTNLTNVLTIEVTKAHSFISICVVLKLIQTVVA
jgi:hypothetical protein